MDERHRRQKSMATKRPKPKKVIDPKVKRRRRIIVWSSVAAGVLLIGGGAYYAMTRPLQSAKVPGTVPPLVVKRAPENRGHVNILLIGTDARPGETAGNTDVLMLASIDRTNKRIEIMSIPRDTKVLYPDGSYDKINASLDLGGAQLTINLVEKLVNMPIDYYALTHFGGLVDVINTLGGITVDVPEPMHYNTGDKQYNIIDLNPGVQTLTGAQALGFVRFRMDALGDIGRTKRQQEFMVALFHKLMQPQNILQLPQLTSELSKTVDTNMTLLQIGRLASSAADFKNYQIIHETLPGAFHNPTSATDASYWVVNPLQAQWVSKQFFYKGVVQPNIIQTEQQTLNWTPPTTAPATNTPSGSNATTNSTSGSSTTGATGNSTPTVAVTNSSPAGSTSGQVGTGASSGKTLTVTSQIAHVRSGPSVSDNLLLTLKQGDQVTLIQSSQGWDEVHLPNGQTGYIAAYLLN